MEARARAGSVVAWWDSQTLVLAVVAGEEKGRIRLFLEQGREARVTPARIAFEVERGAVPGAGVEERRAAGERVSFLGRQLRAQANQVEARLLWEIATENLPDGGEVDMADLSRLALDDETPAARVALIWALLKDRIHFTRKGDAWEARPASVVEELVRQREREQLREREKSELFDSLQKAVAGQEFRLRGTETERRYLEALEQLAIHGDQAAPAARDLAVEGLEASSLREGRPHAAAFTLLRRLELFTDDDENLQIRRFNLRTAFPDALLGHARQLVERGPLPGERADLCELPAISIDGPHTREIDDALSLEVLGPGAVRLGVHIADPSAFFGVGDPVDEEALARGVTHYFPERRLNMLPPAISENAASLVLGERRPALSFLLDLGEDGGLSDFTIRRSWIRSIARLDYDQADRVIGGDESPCATLLRGLADLTEAREARRLAAGGISIRAPDVEFRVDGAGVVSLCRTEPESAARRVVSEAMILAGEVAARYCRDARLPVIYRRQAPPAGSVEVPAPGEWDAVTIRTVRRSLKRAEISLQPGSHASLGLEAYAQVTSPLRRFQDLVGHRQIAARLAGETVPYDAEALQRVAATSERAEAAARRAERACAEYWLLRYLERHTGEELDATVVEVQPRTVIQLDETLWEQPMRGLKGVEAGQRLRVTVERINPRAGLVILRA